MTNEKENMDNTDESMSLADKKLKEARYQMVAKRNDMIQMSRLALSSIEYKMVDYIISKIKPTDDLSQMYYFDCEEFHRLINRSGNRRNSSYSYVKGKLKKIADASWWMDVSDRYGGNKERLIRWFDVVELDRDRSRVGIKFHRDMQPFLFDLIQQYQREGYCYTSYRVQTVIIMRTKYAPVLYAIFKSYSNKKTWVYELNTGTKNDLYLHICGNKLVGQRMVPSIPKSWSQVSQFKKDVLVPACKEINLYSDILVDFELSKTGLDGVHRNSYCSITFHIKNKNIGQIEIAEKRIDDEYKNNTFEDNSNLGFNFEDNLNNFTQDNDIQDEDMDDDEYLIKNTIDVDQEDESIVDATYKEVYFKYPMLYEMLKDDLSEEEIENIFDATLDYRYDLRVLPEMDEDWVCEFIKRLYNHIKRTASQTKVSLYNRLLDAVEHDYRNIRFEIKDPYYYISEEYSSRIKYEFEHGLLDKSNKTDKKAKDNISSANNKTISEKQIENKNTLKKKIEKSKDLSIDSGLKNKAKGGTLDTLDDIDLNSLNKEELIAYIKSFSKK